MPAICITRYAREGSNEIYVGKDIKITLVQIKGKQARIRVESLNGTFHEVLRPDRKPKHGGDDGKEV